MGNTILFNTAGSIALAVNYEIQGPYNDKFATKEAATTIRLNAELFVRVDDAVFCIEDDVDLTEADLDTGSSFDASDTYYLYACHPLDGTETPVFKISKNATYPSGGWSAITSRKLGGFDTDGSGNVDESSLWDLRTEDATLVADASTSVKGKVELATSAETQTGTDTERAVTPAGLQSKVASETAKGIIEIATNSEAAAGSGTDKALVPSNLASILQAIGSVAGDDLDFNGEYAVALQNIADLVAGKGPGYWFDGSDDAITISDDANIDFGTGSFSIVSVFQSEETGAYRGLFSKGVWDAASAHLAIALHSSYLGGSIGDGSTAFQTTFANSTKNIADGKPHVAGVSVDKISATDADIYGYIDGAQEGDKRDLTLSGTGNVDNASAAKIGVSLGGGYLEGTIFRTLVFNLALSAAEHKAMACGAPIPYKYLGASQTELITNGGFETAGAGGADIWANWSESAGDGALANETTIVHGGSDSAKVTAGASANTIVYSDNITVIPGKRVRLSIWTYGDGTNAGRYRIYDVTNAGNILGITSTGVTAAEWTEVIYEFTVPAGCVALRVYMYCSTTNGAVTYFDDFSLKQIGCVLQLEPDGIGHNQWLDKSGNELHGDVSGAIPNNLPVDHTEKYIDLTVTGDTSFTLPEGYLISSITTKETAGNSVGGGIDIGTTNGGGEIVAAHAVTASTAAICALVSGANYNTTGADDTIYITDADGTGWDSASVEIRVQMQRIDM